MVVKEFIGGLQEYYGIEYKKGTQVNLIADYLKDKSEVYLSCLFAVTVKDFSGQYRSLPDIAVFEKLVSDVYEAIEAKRKVQDLKILAIEEGGLVDYKKEIMEFSKKLAEKHRWLKKEKKKNLRVN